MLRPRSQRGLGLEEAQAASSAEASSSRKSRRLLTKSTACTALRRENCRALTPCTEACRLKGVGDGVTVLNLVLLVCLPEGCKDNELPQGELLVLGRGGGLPVRREVEPLLAEVAVDHRVEERGSQSLRGLCVLAIKRIKRSHGEGHVGRHGG